MTHKDEAGGATTAPKKVVYGKRKPRGPAGHTTPGSVAGSSTPGTPQIALQKELEPEPEVAPLVVQSTIPTIEDGASSDEEKVEKEEGLKDDWDASSEEDVKEKTETATEAAMKGLFAILPFVFNANRLIANSRTNEGQRYVTSSDSIIVLIVV